MEKETNENSQKTQKKSNEGAPVLENIKTYHKSLTN